MNRTRLVIFALVFIASLVSRTWLTLRHMDLGSDKCYQLIAAKNLKEGHGYSICVQDADDLSQTLYGPLSGWPPGYSVMIIAAYQLTGDYMQAAVALDVFSVIVLYAALLLFFTWWGKRLNYWLGIGLLVFLGISSAPFYMLFSTDFLALSFYVLASVVFVRWLETGMRNHVLFGVFVLSAVFPPFFRFGFYPLLFVFPFCLMVMRFVTKEKRYFTFSMLTGVLFVAFIVWYSYFQIRLNGQATLMSGERHGDTAFSLHFSNLRMFTPFVFNSYIDDVFIANRLGGVLAVLYNVARIVFTLAIMWFVFAITFKKTRDRNSDFINILTACTIIVNVLFLVALSLKYNMDSNADGSWQWTYVREYRYYSPSYFMIFLFGVYNYQTFSGNLKRILGILILPLVIIGIAYSIFNLAKGSKMGTYEYNNRPFLTKMDELRKHNRDKALVLVNSWERAIDNTSYGSLIQLYGFKVYHDFGDGNLSKALIAGTNKIEDNHIEGIWSNSSQLADYDTVYYLGNDSTLRANIPDTVFSITQLPVEQLYMLTPVQ